MKNSTALSDRELIDLFLCRSEDAIRKTDEKYGAEVYAVSYNILHDRRDVEECKSDTYLDVWNAMPHEEPKNFRAFLLGIARRVSIDKYRERSRSKRVPSELTSSLDELAEVIAQSGGVWDEVEARALGAVINGFIKTISERERLIFVSRYICADSVKKIAEMLDVSKKTVYNELERLRLLLKEKLEKEGFEV